MKFFLGLASAALLISCNRETLHYDKPYFDFDSLVNAQVHQIASARASLIKKTMLNATGDSTIIAPDASQWKHELDAFQQLDVINKPLFKGNYLAGDQGDDHSNLTVRLYKAKIKSPVPEVKFFFQDGRKLKRIESVFNEGNVLYSTSRKLMLEFKEQGGATMISKYRVSGFQKMIFSDSVKFSIDGTLKYP